MEKLKRGLKRSFKTQVVFESSSPLQGDIEARQMEIEIIFHFGVAADQISNLCLATYLPWGDTRMLKLDKY